MDFLTNGPAPATPPEWIDWGNPPAARTLPPSDPESGAVAAIREPEERRRAVWGPFLQPRRSVANNQVSTTNDVVNNEVSTTSSKPFPFPVGTWVAFEFDDGVYPGQIAECYEGEDLCRVEFADGDKADYDGDEIQYASQLYEREFNT